MEPRIDLPPALSVVVPCYNEAETIGELHRRLDVVCRDLRQKYEIVLVDDGSRDATWSLIKGLAARDPALRGVRLARNHGHELALTAGLASARGQRILMLDADLQDPPELLPKMMTKMDEGYDVVYARRVFRKGETWLKRATSHLFYRTISQFSDVDIPCDVGDFRLISRKILDAFLAMPEQTRFVRGMFSWLGFAQTGIDFERDARYGGSTKYRYSALARLAMDALTGFSIAPLRLASFFAFASLGISGILVIYVLWSFFTGNAVPGWASLFMAISFFSGVQLLTLGIMGAYIGRLYMEAKGRPLFLVSETTNDRPATVAAPARVFGTGE